MVNYSTRETTEKVEIITLTRSEFDALNSVYKKAVSKKFTNPDRPLNDMNKIILTDGFFRTELYVEVVDNDNNNK